jgi:hypothetical protein
MKNKDRWNEEEEFDSSERRRRPRNEWKQSLKRLPKDLLLNEDELDDDEYEELMERFHN